MDSRQVKILGVWIFLRGTTQVDPGQEVRRKHVNVKNNGDRPVSPVGCSVGYTSGDKNPQRVRKYLPY